MNINSLSPNSFKGYEVHPLKKVLMRSDNRAIVKEIRTLGQKNELKIFPQQQKGKLGLQCLCDGITKLNVKKTQGLIAKSDGENLLTKSSVAAFNAIFLAEKFCANRGFEQDEIADIAKYTTKENAAIVERLCADEKFPKEDIVWIAEATTAENIALVEKLYENKDFPPELIADITRGTTKDNIEFVEKLCFDEDISKLFIADIVLRAIAENKAFVEKLYVDEDLTKEQFVRIAYNITKDNVIFLEKLYEDKEISKGEIERIAQFATTTNLTLLEKMYADKCSLELIADVAERTNAGNIILANEIINSKLIPQAKICDILNSATINDANDAGWNNGSIDLKKVNRYTKLLQDSKISLWVVDMLNRGFDIETISKLSQTKQSFYFQKPKSVFEVQKSMNCDEQFFMNFGLNEKQASSIIKAISKEGVVNVELQKVAVKLINNGIEFNKIGDILKMAQISGEFNQKIVDDFVSLQNQGLNPLLEKNIAIINNISGADCAVKFNSKIRKQLKLEIQNLSQAIKLNLQEKGIDINSIQVKLDSKKVSSARSFSKKAKIASGFRSKSKIIGVERIVIDKYAPVEAVWHSEAACKQWAEKKYQTFKETEYISMRTNAHVDFKRINRQRAEGLKEWYGFMETEEGIKDNPFIRVLLAEYITKNLHPDNSSIPPVLDKALVKKVLASIYKKNTLSFEKEYGAQLSAKARNAGDGQSVEIDGRKMTWYTVPRTGVSNFNYQTNVSKVRAFSDGTNWCTRTGSAEPYVQKDNMHFLVDGTGQTQVCVRTTLMGQIEEIQNRQQSQNVPVAYVNFVKDLVLQKALSGYEIWINKAVDKLPDFNITKTELQQCIKEKNYKFVLEKMGIDVNVLEDGTWELSHYSPYLNGICLNDYGINENTLLSNVSIIRGSANFKDSNVTSLPNLKEVVGELDFGYTEIRNLKSLTSINGKKINW